MTCIAGVVDKGIVYIGGDSCASSNSWVTVNDAKVFAIGDVLFGVAGSFRLADLVRHAWPGAIQENQEQERFLRTTFVDSLYATLERYRVNDPDGHFDGEILFGYNGRLYTVQSDYSVLSAPPCGMAIGSGSDAARGSLYTTSKLRMTPERRVLAALAASESVTPSVRAPFHVMRTNANRLPRLRDPSNHGKLPDPAPGVPPVRARRRAPKD